MSPGCWSRGLVPSWGEARGWAELPAATPAGSGGGPAWMMHVWARAAG